MNPRTSFREGSYAERTAALILRASTVVDAVGVILIGAAVQAEGRISDRHLH
jgi:hypothetical protein